VRAGQADVGGRRGKVAMKASSDRILTTHTGSLPRPSGRLAVVSNKLRKRIKVRVHVVEDHQS
jgi:hypothetical protein